MRRQKNIFQIKKEHKTLELNEVKLSNLLIKELNVT